MFKITMMVLSLMLMTSCGGQGFIGTQGPNGAVGPAGPHGKPGTSITVVQLCTSCVPVYPSTFAEIAFCIDGNLYGTYSANDGFSAELPPGAYSSDGINCSCSFVIGLNCEVST